jgi:FeS assembly SUF system protein
MKTTSITVNGQPAPGEPSPEEVARRKHEEILARTRASGGPLTLREKVVNVLKSVHDPEIPVNIYELGLIYGIDIREAGVVAVTMTLTSPACPVAQELPLEVQAKLSRIAEVTLVTVDVVWDPPWTPARMSEDARLALGM